MIRFQKLQRKIENLFQDEAEMMETLGQSVSHEHIDTCMERVILEMFATITLNPILIIMSAIRRKKNGMIFSGEIQSVEK